MNSILSYIGGKRLLRKVIVPMIPTDIKGYIEAFGGAGWVLFARDRLAKLEVYNDLDNELTNLFMIIKYHPDALIKEMRYRLSSRSLFTLTIKNTGYTDIQKAARFLYLIKRSFGSKGRSFGVSKKAGGFKSHENMCALVDAIHHRLDMVIIENKDFENLIATYDTKDNFFYFDPPYFKGAALYDRVPLFDHVRLRDALPAIQGRWLLSIDDCEESRDMFGQWDMHEVKRLKGINNINVKDNQFYELLIKNY
jgi:DNA adenine methylase